MVLIETACFFLKPNVQRDCTLVKYPSMDYLSRKYLRGIGFASRVRAGR